MTLWSSGRIRNMLVLLPQTASKDTSLLAYNDGPLPLLWSDFRLFLNCISSIPGIFLPFDFGSLDIRDEMYLGDPRNVVSILLHTILIVLQTMFLVSLAQVVVVPVLWSACYVVVFWFINKSICYLLNGSAASVVSKVPVKDEAKFSREKWIYLNGVSVGHSWLQSNCDRLSETFGRRITGVHNPTDGIIFDLIQCLVQRNFCYCTQDIRNAYKLVKDALLDKHYKKIVFILHSQGGIEGGLIVDWLLDEMPQELLQQLEIYTFGNAANHFNNPRRSYTSPAGGMTHLNSRSVSRGAIGHIEHYANSGDFVSQFGVLNYIRSRGRFMGRLLQSPQSGHLLNQHYLHQMFPLDEHRRASDHSEVMNMEVSFHNRDDATKMRAVAASGFTVDANMTEAEQAFVGDVNSPISPLVLNGREPRTWRVKDFSRLWAYRNGMSPAD